MSREASHVHLVNDGLGSRPVKRSVAFPIVGAGIDNHALHRCRGVVALQGCSFAAVIPGNNDAPAVWVQEDLRGIKAHAICGIERSLNAVAIKLARFYFRYERVPIMTRAVHCGIDRDKARGRRVVFPIKKILTRPPKRFVNTR